MLADAVDDRDSVAALLGSHVFKGVTVEVTRGDYAPIMAAVVEHLTRAKVSCLCTLLYKTVAFYMPTRSMKCAVMWV